MRAIAQWTGQEYRYPKVDGDVELFLLHRAQIQPNARPNSYMMRNGYFLVLRRSEIEADHTPPLSVEVISAWSSTSSPSRLHGIVRNLGLGWRPYCCILSLSQRCRQRI